MRVSLTINLKSGKTKALTLAEDVARSIMREYADWLCPDVTVDDPPMIDVRDAQGGHLVVPFSAVEFLEIEA